MEEKKIVSCVQMEDTKRLYEIMKDILQDANMFLKNGKYASKNNKP